ncbi:MAG: MBOAT family O-acyltransferase [Ferruginibacter sp.]
MQFNSIIFFVFYAVLLLLYFIVPKAGRWLVLLAGSIYFYLCFEPVYALVLAFVILIDYGAAIAIHKTKVASRKNLFYLVALISNIAILIFFKYFNFLNSSLTDLLSFIHISNPVPFVKILLPIGISYFIFSSISYLIDVKNERILPERNIGYYTLYVSFFPHISSGPIARATYLLPQFRKPQVFTTENFYIGSTQVMYGLFKKSVVGDRLGDYVSVYFSNIEHTSGFSTVIACWLFLFQLYADFSGYSDMAVGFARIFGIRIINNFQLPLFSKTMTELWRRWHISLSLWMRDYLFTPITIAKRNWGKYAVVFSQMITFAIVGIWHGAGWQFLFYGIIHGIYLSSEFLLKIKSSYFNKSFLRKCLGVFITFNLLSFSLVFFRSQNMAEVIYTFKNIITNFAPVKLYIPDAIQYFTMLLMLGILLALEYFVLRKNTWEMLLHRKPAFLMFICLSFFMLILWFGISSSKQFIYFQF